MRGTLLASPPPCRVLSVPMITPHTLEEPVLLEEHHLLARMRALLPENGWRLDGIWLRAGMERLGLEQAAGWKLHLASVPVEFAALLDAALPVLATARVPFKVLRSAALLEEMNDGRFGLMQVGKALTVYPADEAKAVRLAQALAESLTGFQGPHIPSDTRFAEGAPVYFRYGPFDARFAVDITGRKHRLLRLPDGRDVPDDPATPETLPAPGLLPVRPPYDHLAFLRGHFDFVRLLQLGAKGATLLAVSKQAAQHPVLIKTARRGTHSDRHGRDALWALGWEHGLLERFAGEPGIPPAGVLLPDGVEVAALVRPWLDGTTFADCWTQSGARLPGQRMRLRVLLREVLRTVRRLHTAGVVVRDLSPGNLLETQSGTYLLDLELAHEINSAKPRYRRGTRGFYPPDTEATPGPAEDGHALRALALMAHTGAHPAWWPALPGAALLQAGTQAAPAFLQAWEAASDSGMATLDPLIEAVAAPLAAAPPAPDFGILEEKWEALLRDTLARPVEGADPDKINVYSGVAGVLLAGIEWDPERTRMLIGEARWVEMRAALIAGMRGLAHLPGLYFGAPGVALALLAGGLLHGDPAAQEEARRLLLDQDRLKRSRVPDLCQGVAGQVHALLAAARLSGEAHWRDAARAAGRHLLSLEEGGQSGVWPWPEGPYGAFSGARHHGFAHGTAGVVHALFTLHETVPESDFLDSARRGLRSLQEAAQAVPEGGGAWWWPVSAADASVWNAWCHGTPGVVKALAQAVRVDPTPESRALLMQALDGMRAGNNAELCLCHGVASRLDACVDAWPVVQGDARDALRASAQADAALLASVDLDRATAPPHVSAEVTEPRGLMAGAAGVLRTLLQFFLKIELERLDLDAGVHGAVNQGAAHGATNRAGGQGKIERAHLNLLP